jgi:hypothetical protein
MKLHELITHKITEGGQVFKTSEGQPKTQRIHLRDLSKTLSWLAQVTHLPIHDHVLGSVGKKTTHGDIDVVVDAGEITKDELVQRLSAWARSQGADPKDHVRKSGVSVHFLTPIGGDPTNGWVQTDFMFSEKPEWMKFSMHSAGDASAYSGADRNMLMSSLAKAQGLKYSWQKGLLRREDEHMISQDPDQIAQILLGPQEDHQVFNSVEQMQHVIHRNTKLLNQFRELIKKLESEQDDQGELLKPGEIRKNQEEAARIKRLLSLE